MGPLLPLLLGSLLPSGTPGEAVPRLSLGHDSPRRRLWNNFQMPGVANYTTMMLSPDGRILYTGAREMLLALNTRVFSPGPQHQQLIWHAEDEKKQQCIFKGKDPQRDCHNYIKVLLQLNDTHLYTCGTSAFSPTCTYISLPGFQLQRDSSGQLLLEDGKGRCPFDPEYRSTAIMVDGELYTGTVSKFQGNEPTILRSLGSRPPIKTESSLNWLQGGLSAFREIGSNRWSYRENHIKHPDHELVLSPLFWVNDRISKDLSVEGVKLADDTTVLGLT